jgi:D-xylonolactonase
VADVQCIWPLRARLGEGPCWVEREQALYFVDILGRSIHRWAWHHGVARSWDAPANPGFVFPASDGRLLCGLRGGLFLVDPLSGRFTPWIAVEADKPHHRLNDGHVDASGRLWFGSMHEDCRTLGGVLYSLEDGERICHRDLDYVIPNGPVVSPDGRTLYHTDSARRTVYAFDLARDGTLSHKRVFIRFAEPVSPDGMAIDQAGDIWIALYGGWRIERYSPDGMKRDEVRLPCAQITKPAFGGEDLQTLFVTSARDGLSPQECESQPLAGGLFAVRVATAGLPPSICAISPTGGS